jgi:AraC-like DNA-binding protein
MIKEWLERKDITVVSACTKAQGVIAPAVESRSWLAGFPICKTLKSHYIIHVGLIVTAAPTRIVRFQQSTTYFLACTGGCGRVFIEGNWQICREGMACLFPYRAANAYEAIPGKNWEFCWVCYQRPDAQKPLGDISSPAIAAYDPLPLRSAILGLMHECKGPAQPSLMQEWTDLIDAYVERFAQPSEHPEALTRLWSQVSHDLRHDWSLGQLGAAAGLGREHLRRMCLSHLGRSPMQHLTYLRMRRASQLLMNSQKTIESIGSEVGYKSPFVFSNAFKHWTGWRPSEYRRGRSFDCGLEAGS